MTVMNNWALVDENGQAINEERFASAGEAHASATPSPRQVRRLPNGRPIVVGRTVWTAQVDESGRVQS